LRDQQRERLGVPGNLQRAGVYRIETHVADQLRGRCFALLDFDLDVVSAGSRRAIVAEASGDAALRAE